ncbi:MAG: DEAD/DEAH box helicase family protein, partial [Nannocystaceae bacterium]|nr:DEAD/DEAH box helicase family protein [Nannocystaceae bacterium]
MQLHFDAQLPHQHDALQVVLGLFEGPPALPPDTTIRPTPEIASVRPNMLPVDVITLLANLQSTQTAAGLPVSPSLPRPSTQHATGIDVALEMETGTGKTYTYVRTILELSKRHGLNKWLIIAPSIAVREGVLGTLRDTREHFRSLLPGVTYRFWAYDGRPERMRSFATAATLEIAVLTIAAFNKISNRLRRPDDRFGGLAPLDWVAAA